VPLGSRREPRFLGEDPNERRKKGFTRHEKKLAKDLGGVTTVGSGNKGMKGDVHGGDRDAGQRIMAEAKSTQARQIALKLDWLEKLVNEAFDARMEPALFLRFDSLGSSNYQDWAVIPKNRYLELLEQEASQRRASGSSHEP